MTDDLDALLSPRPAPPSGVREVVFRRTARRLAFARRVRFVTRTAAVFSLGIGVGWFAKPRDDRPSAFEPQVVIVPVPVPVPAGESAGPVAERPRSPRELELLAEQADDAAEAGNLYRAAGDARLDAHDYANAARCYRLFLTRAGDTALSPAPGDSWLLTSLKNTAYKEKADDPKSVNP